MKQLIMLLLAVTGCIFLNAQSVGVGTATPNASAALEIKSTTKGLLIPSMTTSQRFAINSPVAGLMVYDTDKDEFYHYNGTGWTAIINGAYWSRPITNRNRITNTADSIGIGISSPTERLDVNGNIRSRNDFTADGNISGNSLFTAGNLFEC